MTITFPSNTTDIIDTIRGVIGRAFTMYVTVSGTACTTCTLNPITDTATDPFCEECDGEYWIGTVSGVSYSGHIRWLTAQQALYTAGGVIEDGDCVVTIKNTSDNLTNVERAEYLVVDDRDIYIKKFTLRGVPALNRIRITLLGDSE